MGVLSHLTAIGGRDVAVDFGTANTSICVRGLGIVLSEPTAAVVDESTGLVLSVGIEAKRARAAGGDAMSGQMARPLRDGPPALVSVVLAAFIAKVHESRVVHPSMIVAPAPGIDQRPIKQTCLAAGAGRASVISSALASALGSGLRVEGDEPCLVVDVGATSAVAAVISGGRIEASVSAEAGGDAFDEALFAMCRDSHDVLIAAETAEEAKIEAGSLAPGAEAVTLELTGSDADSGSQKIVAVSSEEIAQALTAPLSVLSTAITGLLDSLPEERSAHLGRVGGTLTGGGALLDGLAGRLSAGCGITFESAPAPLTCAAVGAGIRVAQAQGPNSASKNSGSRSYV